MVSSSSVSALVSFLGLWPISVNEIEILRVFYKSGQPKYVQTQEAKTPIDVGRITSLLDEPFAPFPYNIDNLALICEDKTGQA